MAFEKYKIGGLENSYDGPEKFKYMLRDSLIDWSAFLELNGDIFDYDFVINKVTDLLDIRKIDNVAPIFIDLLRAIFNRDPKQHLQCMIKQYFIYEQRSIAIFKLFTLVKHHYEFLVTTFVSARNSYIESKNLSNEPNDLKSLKQKWEDFDSFSDSPSSSITLLFFNGDSGIAFDIDDDAVRQQVLDLKKACEEFKYPGFCPKEASERLVKLMKFPVDMFVEVLTKLSNFKPIDYKKLSAEIAEISKEQIPKPKLQINLNRPEEPLNLINEYDLLKKRDLSTEETYQLKIIKSKIIRWYVDQIMSIRKELLPYGTMYEKYYDKNAEIIEKIFKVTEKYIGDQVEIW